VVDVPATAPVVDAPAAPVADAPAPTPVVDAPAAPVVDAPVQTPVIDVPAPVNPGQGDDTPVVVDDGLPADLALEPTPSPFGDVNMRGSRLADVLIGDDDSNDLFGFGGNDVLHGMYGDDIMNGGRGADMLYGGEGDDRLFGSRGVDYLDGGEGADTLTGGRGSDTFAFGDQDVITDFKSGEDMIDLNGMGITEANFEDMVSITRDGSDLKVSIGGQTMTLNDERDLDIDDFMLAWEDSDSDSGMIADAIAAVEEAAPAVVEMVADDDDTFGPVSHESLFNLPADLLVPVQPDMFGPMM
jgi:Ca2+-binding RTX toxin-like protein